MHDLPSVPKQPSLTVDGFRCAQTTVNLAVERPACRLIKQQYSFGDCQLIPLTDGPASMNHFSSVALMEESEVTTTSHLCELARRIDTLTQRQIRNLTVVHDTHKVILNGCSRSYYVKQLASQAVNDLMPGVAVQNSIDVLG